MSAKQVSVHLPCPVCQDAMTIRELECAECDITVRGHFGTVSADVIGSAAGAAVASPLAIPGGTAQYGALTAEQAQFMETFLRCRGIIRDMEAALGISYPTVRARLDNLLATLGLTGEAASPTAPPSTPVPAAPALPATPVQPERPSVKEILSRLDSGSLDAQAALDALRGEAAAPTAPAGKDSGAGAGASPTGS